MQIPTAKRIPRTMATNMVGKPSGAFSGEDVLKAFESGETFEVNKKKMKFKKGIWNVEIAFS